MGQGQGKRSQTVISLPSSSGRRLKDEGDLASRVYALEVANEVMGYKPSKTGFVEVFIVLIVIVVIILAVCDCN